MRIRETGQCQIGLAQEIWFPVLGGSAGDRRPADREIEAGFSRQNQRLNRIIGGFYDDRSKKFSLSVRERATSQTADPGTDIQSMMRGRRVGDQAPQTACSMKIVKKLFLYRRR